MEKKIVLDQLDSVRSKIEQTSIEDACKCVQKYHGEEDPLGVAFHDLFYTHVININNIISDIS